MKPLRLVGVMLLAAIALSVVMSSSASALILPIVVKEQKEWKGKNVGSTLLTSSGGTIECKSAEGTGTEEKQVTQHSLGEFHITFKQCTAEFFGSKLACKGLSDSSEIILTLGKWHLVYDKLGAANEKELGVAILFLPELVHLECTSLLLVEVKGQVLCLVLEYKVSLASHAFHCLAKGVVAEEKEYFNAGDKENNPAKVKLECSINHEAFKECSQAGLGTVEYPVAVTIDG